MLLKHLPVGYAYHRIIVDADGKPLDSIILEVNPVFEEITGLTKKEVVGKKATELHYTFNDPAFNWICEYGRLAKMGDSNNFEHCFKADQRWCSITVFKNEPGYFSTFFTDITEKKVLQEQNNFEQLFRHNPTLMALNTLPDRRFVEVNEAFLKTLGYKKEEITGRTSAELSLFAYPAQAEIVTRQIQVKSKVEDLEIQVRCKDGTLLDGIFSGEVFSSKGKQHFLSSLLDITGRKKAETKILEAHQSMLWVLDSIDAVVYVADMETDELLFVNQQGKMLWGEGEGKKCRSIIEQSQTGPCSFCTKDKLLDSTGEPKNVYKWEFKNSFNGRWYDCRDRAMRWYDGRMVRLAIATDITEQKLKEEKIMRISFRDHLTGLYNRSYLDEEMKRLDTKRQLPISMIIADLNGLKLINDTLGHSQGDGMLRHTADILKSSCRKEDIVCRWGGDEFLIFLPQTDHNSVLGICRKIQDNCNNVYYNKIPLSLALGAATKTCSNSRLEETLSLAENRMYKEKLNYRHNAKSFVIDFLLLHLRSKSNETESHNQKMFEIGHLIGHKMGLSEPELSRLELLIKIHDVGMVNISEKMLSKPEQLNAEEWEIIRNHPANGYRIARATEGLARVAEEILCHHESWDGTGYPLGLQGRMIPLLARITAIADAFEVMTSGRPYKKALSQLEAFNELQNNAGKQFDPMLVQLLIKTFKGKQAFPTPNIQL